jgi:hypothetical protein
MTVASAVSRITVAGNSSATSFSFPFKITSSSHLVVTKTTAAGITSSLTLGTHYSVTGVDSESGGSITYPLSGTALPTGDTLTMRRVVPLTQTVDLTNQGAFYAEVHEDEFDNLTYMAQQLSDDLTALDAVVDGLIGDVPGALRAYSFTGDGATVLFTLGVTLTGGVRSVLVAVDGVIQGIETYAVNGTALTFSEAPPYGAAIDVRAIGEAYAATVTDTSLVTATGSVTPRYLSDRFAEIFSVKDFGAVGDGAADDSVAFALALVGAAGQTLLVPAGTYLIPTGGLTVTTNTTLRGDGFPVVKVGTTTLNGLFTVTGSNVTIEGLDLLGNLATQTSASSGSTAITVQSSLSNIQIRGNKVRKWTRHGIYLGGVSSAFVTDNYVTEMWYGGGILSGQGSAASNVHISDNTITTTQWANIHLGDHDGIVVSGNTCDGTAMGSGALDTGTVADNITCYPHGLTLKNAVFANNVCKNSGNHGMHLGGPGIVITGNTVYYPRAFGIYVSAGGTLENPNPDLERVVVSGNAIMFADRTDSLHKGIGIRNVSNFVVTGNQIRDAYDGMEIRFVDAVSPTGKFTQSGIVTGNSLYGINNFGIELNGFVRNCGLFNNIFDIVLLAGEHIRYNTDASITKAQNPTGNNLYVGSGVAPRSWQMQPGDGTTPPTLAVVAGSGTAAGAVLAKGNSALYLGTDNGYAVEVTAPNANTVNRIGLRGNQTGSSPVISATGSDTNLDVTLTPKGSGLVRFGTHAALAAEVVSGYVTIRDAGGTTRKIAVIS